MSREQAHAKWWGPVRDFEHYHAATGGHFVRNLETWCRQRGYSEAEIDEMFMYLSAFVVTDSACADGHVYDYWYGPSRHTIVEP